MSYSSRIYDPSFDKYLSNTSLYRFQFALGLAVAVGMGFYLYGLFSDTMDLTEATYIGIVLGSMFLLIGVYAAYPTRKEPTWDRIVTNKEVLEQYGKSIFVVFIEKNGYEKREIRSENDPTLYDYYRIGDKVRYHGKLKTYEKYDKSRDTIIFCNACSFMNFIEAEYCANCGCPLLK